MTERYTVPNKKILKELVDLDKKAELRKENKELKNQLMLTENDRDKRELKARDLMKENKELKEKLEHYENTKAIQKSNDASRWKPGCMSCVDRELNHYFSL